METTIRINTDHHTSDIIEGIKRMFPHKTIEISIQTPDETEYILNDPEYANELTERIQEYNTKKQTIDIKPGEFV